jgi:NAD+ diphosphatase
VIESALPYSRLDLDRASALRSDTAWLAAQLRDAAATVVPMWRDQCLVRDGRPVMVPMPAAAELLGRAGDPVLLGLASNGPVFAADLSALSEPDAVGIATAQAVMDVRGLFGGLSEADAALLACAKGLLHWHRNQRFCGACGGATEPRDGGHHRACTTCGKLLFARIEPAVIVLIESPDGKRALLARHQGAAPDQFSTLAGFVEIGESLEEAVRREVAEESGVRLRSVSYQGSQAWPFPAGLMVGFRAVAASLDIAVDHAELVEARWFGPDEVADRVAHPRRRDSIGRYLMRSWLQDVSPGAQGR